MVDAASIGREPSINENSSNRQLSANSCLYIMANIGHRKPLKPCCLTFIRSAGMAALCYRDQLN
jgi:hypothetical protein